MPTDTVVILTREEEDNRPLAQRLQTRGIRVLQYPCIKISRDPFPKGAAIDGRQLADFPAVVFTSRRGVSGMQEVFQQLARSEQLLAVVGASTAAAVKEHIGREPGLVADPATGEALAHALAHRLESPGPVLHVRGNKTTGTFKKIMESRGIRISELIVYRNQSPVPPPLELAEPGIAVFASPSAAACFIQNNPLLTSKLDYLAIGPVTAGYLRKQGIKNIYQAPAPNPDALEKKITQIINTGHPEVRRPASSC